MSQAGPAGTRWGRQVIGPFTLGHVVALLVVLVVAAVGLALLTTPIEDGGSADIPAPGSDFYQFHEPTTGLEVGQLAPELEGKRDGRTVTLADLSGALLTLDDRRGSPVWLSFFATWCPPCQEETPVLRDMYREYADDGLEMIAVSVQETTPQDVEAYAETYGLDYAIGFDGSGAIFDTYQGFGLPTHVFIDADGRIAHVRYGPLDRESAAAIIEPMLEAAPTQG